MSERWKLDKYSFVDTRDNSCLNFGLKDISRVILQLNNYEDLLDNYEQQLAAKYKEIDALNKTIFRLSNEKERVNDIQNINYLSFAIQIRKQVCDEIREKLNAHCDYTDEENIGWYLTEHKIDVLLDQIEQGE